MAKIPLALVIALILVLVSAAYNPRFMLGILPLVIVFIGIVEFRLSGAAMSVVGLVTVSILAIVFFHTSPQVAAAAAVYGIFKSFGITISVLATMFMIFLMKEAGALQTISAAIKGATANNEHQALLIGVGFGTLASSLGVVTTSLFPLLLVEMGFTPFAAIAISVLGFDAFTSYSLLSIPLTLPADIFKLDIYLLTYKVNIFLPIVAVLVSIAMLWIVGGRESARRGVVPAALIGFSIGLPCLVFGILRVPVMLIGILSGGLGTLVLYCYDRLTAPSEGGSQPFDLRKTAVAVSPWLILVILALVISVPQITAWLRSLDGPLFWIYDKPVDLDAFAQIYTWIFAATLLSIPVLRPTRSQLRKAVELWLRRSWQPFIAYSLFFGVAYVMAWSAMVVSNGSLVATSEFDVLNMNNVVGVTLASLFGSMFVFVAPWLGLFGSVVGGSEASSNVMFFPIQHKAAEAIGLTAAGQDSTTFMTLFGSHANGGGVASAITPSKINNAAATIGADGRLESDIMKNHVPIVVAITFAVGLLTAIFVALRI